MSNAATANRPAKHVGSSWWSNNNNYANNKPSLHTFHGPDANCGVHHEFTFTQDSQKAGKMFNPYRPGNNSRFSSRYSRSPDDGDRSMRRHDRSGHRGRERNPDRDRDRRGDRTRRGDFLHPRPRFQPVPAHERPILLVSREKTPEQFLGMLHDTFQPVEENMEVHQNKDSASESATMDMDSENGVSQPNSHLVTDITEDEEAVTAKQKKVDVIEMIRTAKAKPILSAPAIRNEVTENDDFISFGFSDNDEGSAKQEERDPDSNFDGERKRRRIEISGRQATIDRPHESHKLAGPENAQAIFSHRDSFHRYLTEKNPPSPRDYGPPSYSAGHVSAATLPPPPGLPPKPFLASVSALSGGISFSLPPKPGSGTKAYHNHATAGSSAQDPIDISSSPVGTPSSTGIDSQSASSLHGAKRKYEDYAPPKISAAGLLSSDWNWKRGSNMSPYPWLSLGLGHSRTLNMNDWLHKEIIDFLSYVSPRRYEHSVRHYVISEIRGVLKKEFRDIDVRVFGSFASELYLPMADLDLAVISRAMTTTGTAFFTKKRMRTAANVLQKAGLAKGKVTVIANAKVPIIKFVERRTGLNVDISFDNLSGITAIKTFQEWRKEYRALSPLTILLKHFLDMRSLNVVYNGGLGGFSVICMIVSMLQLHPGVASGNLKLEQNLGIGLLEFLKLYGHDFETEVVGIDVGRKAYFRKPAFILGKKTNPQDRHLLHIVDPNDPSNNIAKSSFMIRKILNYLGEAYNALVKRMQELHFMTFEERRRHGNSILGILVGGNYSVLEKQRGIMRRVYKEVFREDPHKEERLLCFNDHEQDPSTPSVEWFIDKKGSEVYSAGLAAIKEARNLHNNEQKKQKKQKKRKKGTARGRNERGKGTK